MAVEDYAEAFAIGAEIGARGAVVHIHDPQEDRAIDGLGQICDLAAAHGLRIGLEFMGITPACASIGQAVHYVRQVGRANIGIGMDPLHLIRTGGTAADVLAVPEAFFTYAQICDGRGLHRSDDYLPEALDRLMPGDGDFPLAEILAALPADIAIDVEAPSTSRIATGLPALPHARAAVSRARALVEGLGLRRSSPR
jgi:sugar phosphate isomerase/epimerase